MSQQQIPRPDLPYPGERQSNHWLIHLWIILGGALVIVVAWAALNWPATQEPPAASIHTVVYQAEADAAHGSGRTGMYTLQSDDGGTRQGETNLPMKNRDGATGLTFTGFKSGDFVYLSIQNADAAGSVTCRIVVDGVMISENTSDGGYVIASCKGQVP
jgi:hypothetical protein